MRRHHAANAISLALALSACDSGMSTLNAAGSYSDVAILTSSALLPVATSLERELELEVEYALQPERLLEADVFDIHDKDDARLYKNVIVLGLLAGKDDASRELQRQLAGETMKAVAPRELFLATREDIYANHQNVLFVAGHERNLMQSALARQAGALRGQIELANRERIREHLFREGHNVAVEAKIREHGQFALAVPSTWDATRFFGDASTGSIEIAAVDPTRTVAVMWVTLENTDSLADREWLLELRRRWGGTFLEESLQDDGGYRWSEEMFLGKEHLMLAGFWDNQTYGGPFRTIFHYDAASRRLFGINWLCYAPQLPKHPLMREAFAVVETFQP
jgi:hypothetical protein